MTDSTIINRVKNAADFPGRYDLGNRVWGPNGAAEIEGDRIEDFLAACEKVIPKKANTQYEFYFYDEWEFYGKKEGDVALLEISDSENLL